MSVRPYDAEGTVQTIVENGLCTQCGFCEPICPTRAIALKINDESGEILPQVDADACVMCPLCLAVCPGEEVDFVDHQQRRFGIDETPKYFGYVRDAYLAWSTDDSYRFRAASGGVATRLAAHALSTGVLDYLIFARPRADDPFRTETVLCSDPADLDSAHGSIYYPVPLGEGMNLLFERNVPRDAKLGIIGLPCHLHGALNMFDNGKFRRYRWHIVFGIFCGGTWTYRAVDEYLAGKGLRRDQLSAFSFRSGGWPGNIEFTTHEGVSVAEARHNPALPERINKASIFSANSFFTPHRCLTCSDGMADLADLSFGDPWLKSERGDKLGKTLVVCRSALGASLIESAENSGLIQTSPLSPELAVASQKGMLTFKQNFLAFNRVIALFTRRRTPRYNYSWMAQDKVHWSIHAYTLVSYVNHLVGRHANRRWLRMPLSILQGAIARTIKKHFVRLTPHDEENFFS